MVTSVVLALPLAAGSEFLVPELQVLLYTLVVFLGLLGLLWKFAWGPLMKALEEREQRIAKRIADAEAVFKTAHEKLAEHERRIAAVKQEAAELIAQARRDAEQTARRIYDEAQREKDSEIARAKHEIELAKEDAIHQLRERLVKTAALLAAQVIRREVKPEDHRRFIAEAIAEIEKTAT